MSEQTNVRRIFKTGMTEIHEDASMQGSSNEDVRDILKYQYPEVANATIREHKVDKGRQIVEFLPQSGRKG